MSRVYGRRDRTARLLKLQILLWQYPNGLKIEEIARRCSTSKKTTYRDLRTLESELGIPLWEDGSKRGMGEGYFLPPINFTLEEAMSVFLAARLIQNIFPQNNPSIASMFMKLGAIVPQPLRNHIRKTIEYMEEKPIVERKRSNFNKLTQAWISQHRVKILYQDLSDEKPIERIIETYLIEPFTPGRGNYVIAYCHYKKSIYAYKIDSIIGEVHIENDVYEIPSDFNHNDYLAPAWPCGILTSGELETVKLHFSPRLNRVITETTWYPSQVIEIQEDRSVIMVLRVSLNVNFRLWVLSWGDEVEVLEPEILRNQITEIAQSLLGIYAHKKQL